MNTKTFGKKLRRIIEESGEFEIDIVDMKEVIELGKKAGFDDVIYVTGQNESVFTLSVCKIM